MTKRLIICTFCVLLLGVEAGPAQTPSQPVRVALNKLAQQFVRRGRDFVDFANGDEYQPSFDLSTAAMEGSALAASADTLLEIYGSLGCAQDRDAVRGIIRREFETSSKKVGVDIQQVNLSIDYTKKPGVAAEAVRMRDDFRELKDLLDSPNVP